MVLKTKTKHLILQYTAAKRSMSLWLKLNFLCLPGLNYLNVIVTKTSLPSFTVWDKHSRLVSANLHFIRIYMFKTKILQKLNQWCFSFPDPVVRWNSSYVFHGDRKANDCGFNDKGEQGKILLTGSSVMNVLFGQFKRAVIIYFNWSHLIFCFNSEPQGFSRKLWRHAAVHSERGNVAHH